MDLRTALATNFNLQNLILKGAYVVCIAVAFEIIAWWAATRLDKVTNNYMGADAGREHNWRMRRRAVLKNTPRIISRTVCYTIAIILVFDLFGVPVLPLSLAVGAVIALFGSGLMPLLRDASQGYALLAEDALAVGDVVSINGHTGIVERFTLRGVAIRDNEGHTHLLSNRDIQSIIVIKRRAEEASKKIDPSDPLGGRAPVKNPRS